MDQRISVVQYGAGAIGSSIARLVTHRPDLELVGVIDSDPTKVGRDAGEALGFDARLGFDVEADPGVLSRLRPKVVLHSTGSRLELVAPQITAAVEAGCNVISTCEELAFPSARSPDLAAAIDLTARSAGVAVLGTGVNPGFVMDALPAMLSAVCENVTKITVRRVVDTAMRRRQLQMKTGLGLELDTFAARAAKGEIRHVGLSDSARLLAHGIGLPAVDVDERIEPIVAKTDLDTPEGRIQAGSVSGVHQTVTCRLRGQDVIVLDLWMAYQIEDPRDEIQIAGSPPVNVAIPGGISGDTATAGIVVNAIHSVLDARSGLLTMLDVPLVRARLGGSFAASKTTPTPVAS